jgi:signal transduction histidine kinase
MEQPEAMFASRTIRWYVGLWIALLVLYAGMSWYLHQGPKLMAFGDIVMCLIPLVANAGLLLNAGTPHWRRNIFWMLLALNCTLWLIAQLQWTYYEVYLRTSVPGLDSWDMFVFFRGIPIIAALALRPHLRFGEDRSRLGYLDFALLLTWWAFLYVYVVLPWMYATPSLPDYNHNFNLLANLQHMIILCGLGALWLKSSGKWRLIYAHLFAASACYMLASLTVNVANDQNIYFTGSLYDLPVISSFLWFGLAGLTAFQYQDQLDEPVQPSHTLQVESSGGTNIWATRIAMVAIISLPLFAIYTLRFAQESPQVRNFRLMATFIAALPMVFLFFLRTHLAETDRAQLLARSESSIDNLQRLQAQLVQTEKLVSLGQLAAGAAHEINNPLTAILGFSDLLADDPALPEKSRVTASKIRDQARRTKTLVQNLLSFARQVPAERSLLDINTVVNRAMELRALDLRSTTSRVDMQLESVLPGVRGDGNQLMQVFFNIISNALDAMGSMEGGVLTIKTLRDRSSVVVLLSDNGPGIKDPHRVFDPFYTTKPVGKGTGLGLSICFGIVQEHGGKILCYNGQRGGAVFRVELPAVLAAFPTKDPHAHATPVPPSKQVPI